MILAIDVGSTYTKLGVWSGKCWVVRSQLPSKDLHDTSRVAEAACEFPEPIKIGIVASVKPQAVATLRSAFGFTLVEMVYGPRFGVPIRYLPPESLGADRLANILGAQQYTPPVLVIDAGTATTFEAIDVAGAFIGGAIMPGPSAWCDALYAGAPHLPRVEFSLPKHSIGNTSESGIQSGLAGGYAGALQGQLTRMLSELGGSATVVTTGGAGELVKTFCPAVSIYNPVLTLEGLVEAANRYGFY